MYTSLSPATDGLGGSYFLYEKKEKETSEFYSVRITKILMYSYIMNVYLATFVISFNKSISQFGWHSRIYFECLEGKIRLGYS